MVKKATPPPSSSPTPDSTIFYDQLTGIGRSSISSQYFPESSSGRRAADDFVIPTGNTWTINTVEVVGMYSGGTGAHDVESVRVQFYRDSGSALPGTLVYSNTVDIA